MNNAKSIPTVPTSPPPGICHLVGPSGGTACPHRGEFAAVPEQNDQ